MIYILDFDGTIFDISLFGLIINKDKVIPRKQLSKILKLRLNNNILLTGRSIRRKDEIIHILNEKGYSFNKIIFRDFSLINPLLIRKRYIEFKMNHIRKIANSTDERIIVIDNDKGVIKRCKKLGIEGIEFDISKL